jgi:hypothetical protein
LKGVVQPPVTGCALKIFFALHCNNLKQQIMPAQIVTLDDLRDLKMELLESIKTMLKENHGQPAKKWLKSPDVRKLLNISPGTLQNLRVNGTLPYTKIGGALYYDYEDIQKIFLANKKQNKLF